MVTAESSVRGKRILVCRLEGGKTWGCLNLLANLWTNCFTEAKATDFSLPTYKDMFSYTCLPIASVDRQVPQLDQFLYSAL